MLATLILIGIGSLAAGYGVGTVRGRARQRALLPPREYRCRGTVVTVTRQTERCPGSPDPRCGGDLCAQHCKDICKCVCI